MSAVTESGSADPIFVDDARAAALVGISRVWFQRARREGVGPKVYRVGRRCLYRVDELVRWVESGQAARDHIAGPRKQVG